MVIFFNCLLAFFGISLFVVSMNQLLHTDCSILFDLWKDHREKYLKVVGWIHTVMAVVMCLSFAMTCLGYKLHYQTIGFTVFLLLSFLFLKWYNEVIDRDLRERAF